MQKKIMISSNYLPQSHMVQAIVPSGVFNDENDSAAGVTDFYLQETEVTLHQYQQFDPLKINPEGDNHPNDAVVAVNFVDCVKFANWLSNQEGLDTCYILDPGKKVPRQWGDSSYWECDFSKDGYRLPTGDEWVYTAKGGRDDIYATDDGTLSTTKVWYAENTSNISQVKTFPPNPFGIYNLTGNAQEQVWDCHSGNTDCKEEKVAGRIDFRLDAELLYNANKDGLRRGGCYNDYNPTVDYNTWTVLWPKFIGFRLARTIK